MHDDLTPPRRPSPATYSSSQSQSLPHLGEDDSEEAKLAAREFVKRKHLLDEWGRDPSQRWRLPLCIPDKGTLSTSPHTFVMQVLPFASYKLSDEAIAIPGEVPLDRTIGENWKRRNHLDLTADQSDRFRAELMDPKRADLGDAHMASFIWFKPLGIFVACEGKNRVRFLQDVGETRVPARVTCRGYPAPERIKLFYFDMCGHASVWATLDDRLVQALPYYGLAADLLASYGVGPPARWPTEWPSPTDIARVHAREHVLASFIAVDLADLQNNQFRENQETTLSIFDIRWLSWNYMSWLALSGTAVVATVAGFSFTSIAFRCAAFTIAGGIFVGFSLLGLPLWRGRRSLARSA